MYVEFIEQNLTTSLHQTVIQRLLNLYNESKSITSERREPWIVQTIRKLLPALNWIISLSTFYKLVIAWRILSCPQLFSLLQTKYPNPFQGPSQGTIPCVPPTDHSLRHSLTSPDGAEPPFLCFRGYGFYESHLSAATFITLTTTEHCQLMLSF